MEWMGTIAASWLSTLGWLAGLAAGFAVLVRLTPCNPGMYWWKDLRAGAADFLYWLVLPLVARVFRMAVVVAGVALLYGGADPDLLPVGKLPLWQQCLLVLLVQDVLMYASHRAFHTRFAWRFHAIHHSPKVLDWMSTARFHPVNFLLGSTLADVAVLLLGFSWQTLAVLAPFNVVYSAMVHANLNWTFGPLRYVFASPVFHRWHHTTQEEGLDKNFAPTFPFLDLMFGTFYMPAGKLPEHFGNGEPDFPEGFWAQLILPFRVGSASGEGVLAWARRRPALASLIAAALLGGIGLVVGAVRVQARLQGRNERLAGELKRARSLLSREAAALHASRVRLARRAWEENDLAGAAAILDDAPEAFRQTSEQLRLRELCDQKCKLLAGHARAVTSVALSADGTVGVSGSEDGTLKVWDVRTGKEQFTLKGHTRAVRSVGISGDAKRIVSGSFDRTVKVWDVQTRSEKLTLKGHAGAVLSVAISSDGSRIVSGSADLTAKVWDAATGRLERTLEGHTGAVLSVAISADGERVVTASWRTAKVWNGRTGRAISVLSGHTDLVYGAALSPDGKHAVTGGFDLKVRLWDAETGEAEGTFTAHTAPVLSVAVRPDGKTVVSGSQDRSVKVWDARTQREQLSLKGHTDSVTAVAVSGDGRRILSGGADGAAKVWNVPNCARRDEGGLTRRD
jgi:sterol desaturase/sphingolipid hydroxylase (fatty acid hydroxylase superfamily)